MCSNPRFRFGGTNCSFYQMLIEFFAIGSSIDYKKGTSQGC